MSHNWDDMRYFLALCRSRSFLAAANELKVTHSTVSRRISALEEALQTTLFQRTEKGCRLTAAAEALLPYAQQMESAVIGLEESVAGKDKQLSGSVRVGAPDGIGTLFLAPRLWAFQAQHPALVVELTAVPMYYSLSKREIDISITVKKPTAANVVARKLTDYRFGLYSTAAYLRELPPIRQLDDLRHLRFVGYIDDLLFDQELRYMEEFSPKLRASFKTSTIVAQMGAVLAGGGICVLPYFMAHSDPRLVPVLPELSIQRSYWLQVNPDTRQLARVRATIDFIAGQIEDCRGLFMEPPGKT